MVSKRFYLDGRVQYLDLHFNGTDGSLGFLEFDALYRFRPNVSFALGFNAVKAHLSSTQSKQSGFYDFHADGPGGVRPGRFLGRTRERLRLARLGSANSTRLFAAAARFHSPAVSSSLRGGYGVAACEAPAFSKATVIAPDVR